MLRFIVLYLMPLKMVSVQVQTEPHACDSVAITTALRMSWFFSEEF